MAKSSEIKKQLSNMDKLYSTSDTAWFDFFDDNVTIYTNKGVEPIIGKDTYVKNFANTFVKNNRTLKVLSRQIQSLGSVSIVHQVVSVTQDGVNVNMKQTQVWSETKNGLKINHLHSSIIGSPQATSGIKNLGSIQILNEKIATIATAVGVAQ